MMPPSTLSASQEKARIHTNTDSIEMVSSPCTGPWRFTEAVFYARKKQPKSERLREEARLIVITSYSIHYTKLYDHG